MSKVLVLIPNYNHGPYVSEAIESALNQTYKCDVLVVDDGSTDNSKNVINKYPVNKIFKENRGPGHTRNTGINWALKNGYEYIQLLDADDFMCNNKVEVLLPIFDLFKEIGIVYDDYFHLYRSGTSKPFSTVEFKLTATHDRMWAHNLIHCNSLVKSEVFENTRLRDGVYFDENLRVAQDYDFWLRAIQSYVAWHHPEPLSYVREGANNSAGNSSRDIRIACMQALRNRPINKKFYE